MPNEGEGKGDSLSHNRIIRRKIRFYNITLLTPETFFCVEQ